MLCLYMSYDMCVKFRGQLEEVDSFLLPSDFWVSNLGPQPWQQAPIPSQPIFCLNVDYFEGQTHHDFLKS